MFRLGNKIAREFAYASQDSPVESADNLATKVFFPSSPSKPVFYVHHRPMTEPPMIQGFPKEIKKIGVHENNILGKLIYPPSLMIVLEGMMGTGKTTTIEWITQVLKKLQCQCTNDKNSHRNRLIEIIDFRKYKRLQIGAIKSGICRQLFARFRILIDDNEEFGSFWRGLFQAYSATSDVEINHVVAWLISMFPRAFPLAGCDSTNGKEKPENTAPLISAKEIESFRKHVDDNPQQMLEYLILLGRHIVRKYYGGNRSGVVIINDNLDSVPAVSQAEIVNFYMTSFHQDGPTFLLTMRPETRMTRGIADEIVDLVPHNGPSLEQVIRSRLQRFLDDPDAFRSEVPALFDGQFGLLRDYVSRVASHTGDDQSRFYEFINDAAGRSVRIALLLAQGMFFVEENEMRSSMSGERQIVRACINQLQPQYKWHRKAPIEMLFNIQNVAEEGRYLIKPRIIKYLIRNKNTVALNKMISTFIFFGYEKEDLRKAVNEMLRAECQILATNGRDHYQQEEFGDINETLFLTQIGLNYGQKMLSNIDYVQEVMLDSYVDEKNFPAKEYFYYSLTSRIRLLHTFLRELALVDNKETIKFVEKNGNRIYVDTFGDKMIIVEILQDIYPIIGRILNATLRKRQRSGDDISQTVIEYGQLSKDYLSLVRQQENVNNNMLGVAPEPVREFALQHTIVSLRANVASAHDTMLSPADVDAKKPRDGLIIE